MTFRVDGEQPEMFDAVTGQVHQSLLFTPTTDHRTSMPLSLEPYGSVFVIFRYPAAKNFVVSIARNGTSLYVAAHPDQAMLPEGLNIQGDGAPTLNTPLPGDYDITFSNGDTKHLNTSQTMQLGFPAPGPSGFHPIGARRRKFNSLNSNPGPHLLIQGSATFRAPQRTKPS